MGITVIKRAVLIITLCLSIPAKGESKSPQKKCEYEQFQEKGLYGFKDCKGKVKVKAKFQWAGNFHESFCLVIYKGIHKFIDKKGSFLKTPRFDSSLYFSEGMAPVKIKGKWGYINNKGSLVIKPAYDDARTFRKGTALVSNTSKEGIKWGLIDKEGKLLIPVKHSLSAIHKIISKRFRSL